MRCLLILVSMVVLLGGCGQQQSLTAAEQSIRPARLYVVPATGSSVQHQFVGRVEAAQSIDVSFQVSGPLQQLPVLEGQTVAEGELVAALDAKDFELAVREAQVQLQLARQDLQRKVKVLEQKGIARSVVDDARSQYELQSVRLQQAQERLADSRIVAPFDAYVARRYSDNYVNVSPGEPIVRLNDLHQLLIVASVPEALLATATTEQVVSTVARFDFIPDQQFELTYRENRGEADPVAQTYEVSFSMRRPEQWNVLPGMTATVAVELRDTSQAAHVEIPVRALGSESDGSFVVWRYDADTGGVAKAQVDVGAPDQRAVRVSRGLRAGDLIVATGASQLQSDMRIRPLGEPQTVIQ